MGYPSFNTGDVLAAADMNNVGLWKITSGTIAAQGTTPTNITSVFTNANYNHYRIAIYGDNASSTPRLQLKLLSGTTPSSTAYYAGGLGSAFGADTLLYFQRTNGGTELLLGGANGQDRSLMFDVMYPNTTEYTTFAGHATFTGDAVTYHWGGTHLLQTAYDGFQLFTSTGTIRLKYHVYGYRD